MSLMTAPTIAPALEPLFLVGWLVIPALLACRLSRRIGYGHFGPAVCLDPTCHESHEAAGFTPIESPRDKFVLADGHHWQCCQLCDRHILSDAGSWGTYALCIGCYNAFARASVLPPTTPQSLVRFTQTGIIIWQSTPNGKKLVVSRPK